MKERNMTISASKANWYGIGFFIVLYIAARFGFKLIWGEEDPAKEISEGYFILALVAGFVVHELIHGLGWMLASGCGWKNISFGFMWSALMPYCHCDVPMRMKAYRIGGLAPLVILGILPLVIGLAWGSYSLTCFGVFLTIGAIGDIMMICVLRHEPADKMVIDHPSEPGCVVYDEE